jgi:hypothetical protein
MNRSLTALLALVGTLLLAHAASAGPLTLVWVAGAGATSADIDQKVCTGPETALVCAPWAPAQHGIQHAAACQQGQCALDYVAPAGLVLFRFTQRNANGAVVRADAGAWHNEAWTLPGVARDVGTK